MNSNLLLGVPQIDYQHNELFRSFQSLLSIGVNDEAVSEILSRLSIQIHQHFDTEERFMAGLNMPAAMLLGHEQAHFEIIEDLTEFHLQTMHGLEIAFQETVSRLATHLHHHVIEFDLPLKQYIEPREKMGVCSDLCRL